MRHSRPIILLAGCLGLLGSVLTSASSAAAVSTFQAWITCDSVTNTVKTGVSGPFGEPNLDVSLEFKVQWGFSATATTSASIPATGRTTTVSARSSASGDLTANGYSRAWPVSAYLFYTEKVDVTIKNRSGGILAYRSASCSRDLRTVVTLTCDRDAQTITAKAEGTQFNEYAPGGLWIRYDRETKSRSQDGPTFISYYPSWAGHMVMPANGAFSDVGWVSRPRTDLYHYEETVWATIILAGTGRTIGHGTTTCVFSDHSSST
jgi:hypothetical protein